MNSKLGKIVIKRDEEQIKYTEVYWVSKGIQSSAWFGISKNNKLCVALELEDGSVDYKNTGIVIELKDQEILNSINKSLQTKLTIDSINNK